MPRKAKPKPPKGTRDFGPAEMKVRETVLEQIKSVFQKHGAVSIDTPVFELKDTLMGKYGEEQKLVYELADQGGEICCLRYDLTVPFARFVASNAVDNIKRYHIGKVYRRDQPGKGRFREFYQCDFDIAGNYASMVPDAEVVTVMAEVLKSVDIGDFVIYVNHRGFLDAALTVAGISNDLFKPVCSSIDKLDKHPWPVVAEELKEKGLNDEQLDSLKDFVQLNSTDPMELLARIKELPIGEVAQKALSDMEQLFEILRLMPSIYELIKFDCSLARGLDYYTGIVIEAKLIDTRGKPTGGSIGGGGRYDDLLSMFSSKATPAVGMSIGIERIFALAGDRLKVLQKPHVLAYVGSPGKGRELLLERIKIASLLWENDISAEYFPKEKPRMDAQLTYCLNNYIPFLILVGEDELAKGCVSVKNLREEKQEEVGIADLIDYIRRFSA
ncbi:hypothetical protein P9112_011325 [Eukaryota sp. TZLM1-RC]